MNCLNNRDLPLVSVIIPTYNRAQLIGRAIQSVLNQTYQNFELLIIDDGSIDNTEVLVKGFSDKRIRFFRHERNQGQNAALNTGIRVARGKYVAFLDSDDEWLPEMLQKQVRIFQGDNGLGVVYTWAGEYQDDGVLKPMVEFCLSGYIYKHALAQGYVSHMITMMVNTACFDTIGLFDVNFGVCQDDDICLRLAKEYRFGLIPEILAIVHGDGESRITKNPKSFAIGWWQLFSKHGSEIRRVCGNKVMAKHWVKCGRLFLRAKDKEMALSAFKTAFLLERCWKNRWHLLFARQPQWLRLSLINLKQIAADMKKHIRNDRFDKLFRIL